MTMAEKDLGCYDFAEGQLRAWDVGHWQTVADTQAALTPLTPTAIVVANHAQRTTAMGLTQGSSWSAKMCEHFVPVRPDVPPGDQLPVLIDDGSYPGGLITEVHGACHPTFTAVTLKLPSASADADRRSSLAVDFCRFGGMMYNRSLAAFLVGMSEYSYYACTQSWGYTSGWDKWSDDYDRPLGEPRSAAHRSPGGVYHRAFASGTEVWLDSKDETASAWGSSCIKWADGHITHGGRDCRAPD